jgi:acetate kinase
MRVLAINAGSSSLKHALVADGGHVLATGEKRWDPGDGSGRHRAALQSAIADAGQPPDAVGHRVVHGGSRFAGPARLDEEVRRQIKELTDLAPLHNSAALEGIDAATEAFPGVPQAACFDTAFHHTISAPAATYAIPGDWSDQYGIRRFGFHGLNVEACAGRATELVGAEGSRRLIVCHLGSGCSVTAVLDGRSVDTSMGFTPMEGVPMATRTGSIDPGIVLYLARQEGVEEVDRRLNHEAGYLGVSGRSADLRDVIAGIDEGDERCGLAFDVFVRGVSAAAASMTTALGGLDCLVFTAGTGEGSPLVREAVAARLAHLGVRLDPDRNQTAQPDADISIGDEPFVRVLVLAAAEEIVIVRQTAAVLGLTQA